MNISNVLRYGTVASCRKIEYKMRPENTRVLKFAYKF